MIALRGRSKGQPKTSQFPKYLFTAETKTGVTTNSPRSTVITDRLHDSRELSEEDLFRKLPLPSDLADESLRDFNMSVTPLD